MKLVACDACGHDNMFIERQKMICRVCGGKQDIPLSIPNVNWIRDVIWSKSGKDLEHVNFHKNLFRFREDMGNARKICIYYNILIYMTYGKTTPQPV